MLRNDQSLEQVQVPMNKIAPTRNLYFYHKIWTSMLSIILRLFITPSMTAY
jgi:hypothetical protein